MFVVSLLFVATVFLRIPVKNILCVKNTIEYRDCIASTHTFDLVALAFLPVLIITPVLFFVRRETFMAWAIFAAVGFPIMLGGLLYAFNIPQSTGGWVSGPNEAQVASFLLPGLFVIISLILIAVKSWKLRGK